MSAWTAARHMSKLREDADVTWTRDPDGFLTVSLSFK